MDKKIVGIVTAMYGYVKVISADGITLSLHIGDAIYEGDLIITDNNGSITISFNNNNAIDIGNMSEIIIDKDVYGSEPFSETIAKKDDVDQIVEEEKPPVDIDNVDVGGGGGHPIVYFSLDGNTVTPKSGADTIGITTDTVDVIEGVTEVYGDFISEPHIPKEPDDNGVPFIPLTYGNVDNTPTNGSGALTDLMVNKGDVIKFNWSFDTDDYMPWNDFGFVTFGDKAVKLADICKVGNGNAIGWAEFTYVVEETGKLPVGFGIMNTLDDWGGSYLMIDNLTLNGNVIAGFENLSGWKIKGDVTLASGNDEGGQLPTEGSKMLMISNDTGIPYEKLEAFFHFSEGTIGKLASTSLAEMVWATADEDGLTKGIPGGEEFGDVLVNPDPDWDETTFRGTLPFNYGPDGPGELSFFKMDGVTGKIGIEDVTYSWDGDLGVLTATSSRGDLFTITMDTYTGEYSLKLLNNIIHQPPSDGAGYENNAYVQQLIYTVTDVDGDFADGKFNLILNDDMPGSVVTKFIMEDPYEGTLPFGADGAGHVIGIAGTETNNIDTTPDADGKLSVVGKYGGLLIVDSSNGDYIYTPPEKIPTEDNIEIFQYTLIDGDGDIGTSSLEMLLDNTDNNIF